MAALPKTVKPIAVLDRTKEPGAVGEPMYQAVVTALAEAMDSDTPPFAVAPQGHRRPLRPLLQGVHAVDGQAGLRRAAGREAQAPLHRRHLRRRHQPVACRSPRRSATRGRRARSRRCSSASARTAPSARTRRRSRSSARARTCSPRATSSTTPRSPARSPRRTCGSARSRSAPRTSWTTRTSWPATSSACCRASRSWTAPSTARRSCSTARTAPTRSGSTSRPSVQQQLVDKQIDLWVIDAMAVAAETGMGNRINTIMQPCFFHLSGVLPAEEAIARIKDFVKKTYGKRGDAVVQRNYAAIDASIARLGKVTLRPGRAAPPPCAALVPDSAPDFVRDVTARLMAGEGDLLPGQRAARGRHVPDRHHQVREAGHRPADPGLGRDDLHRLRQVRHGLPARVDPDEGLPGGERPGPRRASCPRSSSPATCRATASRSRSPRTTAPAAACAWTSAPPRARRTSATRPSTWSPTSTTATSSASAGTPSSPSRRSTGAAIPHDTVKGASPARAAVRVQRRLRRLRRDAVPAPRHPALRRPDDRGQRHGLLHRSTAPTCRPPRRPSTPRAAVPRGPTACSRTTPSSAWACASALDAQTGVRPRPARRQARRRSSARTLAAELLDSPQDTEPEIVAQRERVATAARDPRGRHRRARGGRAPAAGAVHGPRQAGRLDHRRRRLGLRHRLRRAGPGPLVRPQREHPRPRHRGLLQHRRPGLQGHPARRRREVRGRRQAHRQEGPGRHRPGLRQRLRGPDLAGRQRRPDDQGAPRGRGLAGAEPRHRLLHLHRARHRHEPVHEPPEGRRQVRLLAALPLPAQRGRGRDSRSSSTRAKPSHADQGVRGRPRRGSRSSSARTRSGPPSWPS